MPQVMRFKPKKLPAMGHVRSCPFCPLLLQRLDLGVGRSALKRVKDKLNRMLGARPE